MSEIMPSEKRKPKNKYKYNGNHVEYLFIIILFGLLILKAERKKSSENISEMFILFRKVMAWNDSILNKIPMIHE